MIKIEEKFFHGIELSTYISKNDLTSIKILELILKSEKILSRQDLMTENPYIYVRINSECKQEMNQICVSSHPNNKIFLLPDNRDKFNVPQYKKFDAFYDWILPNISFILSEQIIINNSYSTAGGVKREIMIDNSIDLREYVEAIGYHDKITQIVNIMESLIKKEDYDGLVNIYSTEYYNSFIRLNPENIIDIKEYINKQYTKYNKIKELLKKYSYDIPIIDPFTGKEHKPIEDSIINAQKVLSKRKELLITRNKRRNYYE